MRDFLAKNMELLSAIWAEQKNWIKFLRESLYKLLGT